MIYIYAVKKTNWNMINVCIKYDIFPKTLFFSILYMYSTHIPSPKHADSFFGDSWYFWVITSCFIALYWQCWEFYHQNIHSLIWIETTQKGITLYLPFYPKDVCVHLGLIWIKIASSSYCPLWYNHLLGL